MSQIQTLTQFQIDLMYQLSAGPAPAVVVRETEELSGLVATKLVETHETSAKSYKIVMLTDAGFAFCRNSGNNLVN